MMDPNWRVAADFLSVAALFFTALVALLSYRFQKMTTASLRSEKIVDRVIELENALARLPTKDDFKRLEDRQNDADDRRVQLERSVAGIQASLEGLGKMMQGISNSVNLIQTHLLAQARGSDE